MDSLIQLGSKQNNSQPFSPHLFDVLDDIELHFWSPPTFLGYISSSSGFDKITPIFIKCACTPVPKQNERSWEHDNVLVPHFAALFKLLIAKANIPRKEAKLISIHKKGPVAQSAGAALKCSDSVRYLGVTFYWTLNDCLV